MKKVGIFAGTFDPIHNGHLAFAHSGLDAGLEKVYFLVEPRPRRKQGVRALEHRHGMVAAAIADEPRLGSILSNQARFTPRDTLPPLQHRFKGAVLSLMFGDDVILRMIDHIAEWPYVEELAESTELLIGARYHSQVEIIKKLDNLRIQFNLPFAYRFVEPKAEDISSSRIRAQLKRAHRPKQMPLAAVEYARAHGLYTPTTE